MKTICRQLFVVSIIFVGLPGAGLLYCYFFNQFWTHLDLTGLSHIREYNSVNIRGYRGQQILIHHDFLGAMQRLDACARMSGVRILVLHSYRRPNAVLKDVKVSPGQRSNHLAGHALDINIRYRFRLFMFEDLNKGSLPTLPSAVQAFIQRIREDPRIRWGGDFPDEDPIHLDDGLNLLDQRKWQRHVEECSSDVMSAPPKWRRWLHQRVGL